MDEYASAKTSWAGPAGVAGNIRAPRLRGLRGPQQLLRELASLCPRQRQVPHFPGAHGRVADFDTDVGSLVSVRGIEHVYLQPGLEQPPARDFYRSRLAHDRS